MYLQSQIMRTSWKRCVLYHVCFSICQNRMSARVYFMHFSLFDQCLCSRFTIWCSLDRVSAPHRESFPHSMHISTSGRYLHLQVLCWSSRDHVVAHDRIILAQKRELHIQAAGMYRRGLELAPNNTILLRNYAAYLCNVEVSVSVRTFNSP